MPTYTDNVDEISHIFDASLAVRVLAPPPPPTAPVPPPRPVSNNARVIRRGQDEYQHALAYLLPWGIGWPRWLDSTMMKVVRGLAGILGVADNRFADLLERESYPLTAVEMLPEWETDFGLPDPCYEGPSTITERQRAVMIRMLTPWDPYHDYSQSREWYIALAAFLGYDVSITEYRPFMAGVDRAGDNRKILGDGTLSEKPAQIGDPARLRFAWTMNVHRVRLTWFRAAAGQAGIDPHLRIQLALDLECVIRRWRPAHTEVLFNYSGLAPEGDHFAGTP